MITVSNLVKTFPVRGGGKGKRVVHAVQDVSFAVPPGGVLALVGESGSGKSTIGRLILRLVKHDGGSVMADGTDLLALDEAAYQPWRRRIQVVFQDPYTSLNPSLRVGTQVAEPLVVHGLAKGAAARERAGELLALVGMAPDALDRFPREFSGGQRQRISIARALALDPDFLVLDEPVSALDVSIQAQVLNLLSELRRTRNLSYLLISHNLAVVRQVAERTAVLYLGRIVEIGDTDTLYTRPRHPYTRALLDAVPGLGKPLKVISGEIPSNIDVPPGCPFHDRCPLPKVSACTEQFPPLSGDDSHRWACWVEK